MRGAAGLAHRRTPPRRHPCGCAAGGAHRLAGCQTQLRREHGGRSADAVVRDAYAHGKAVAPQVG